MYACPYEFRIEIEAQLKAIRNQLEKKFEELRESLSSSTDHKEGKKTKFRVLFSHAQSAVAVAVAVDVDVDRTSQMSAHHFDGLPVPRSLSLSLCHPSFTSSLPLTRSPRCSDSKSNTKNDVHVHVCVSACVENQKRGANITSRMPAQTQRQIAARDGIAARLSSSIPTKRSISKNTPIGHVSTSARLQQPASVCVCVCFSV